MNALGRLLSRTTAKPYRTKDIEDSQSIYTNVDGHLDFAPNDPENPKNWSAARRWYITLVGILLVMNATFASSSPTGAVNGISADFGVSLEATDLVTTLFLLGYVFGPLFWAPLSEFYGRRWVLYITFSLYLVFNFECAWTPSFAGLLVGRFLTGTFVSAPLSNVPGLLADLWPPIERGNAMALFSAVCFIGPALGPVISGFLQLKENWRWTFYVLLWLGGIVIVPMFTIPETLAPVILLHKAKRIRSLKISGYEDVKAPVEDTDRSLKSMYAVALTRPWRILIDPISLFCAIYLSVVYALLYMLFTIYPIVFQEKRGWNTGVGELPLIGTCIGAVFGGILCFLNSRRDKKRMLAGYKARAEDRMPVAMVGGIMFAISMFWFGWSAAYNSVPWIVPTLAGVFIGTAILLLFVAFLNYITDTYLMYAASAIAANTVCRSAFGATAPLYTEYMFDKLGVGGGASLIGGVAVLLAPVPFIFYKYGEPIRVKSKFAPTPSKSEEVKSEAPKEQRQREEDEEEEEGRADGDADVEKPKDDFDEDGDRSSISPSEKDVEAGDVGLNRFAAMRYYGGGDEEVDDARLPQPPPRIKIFPRREDFF